MLIFLVGIPKEQQNRQEIWNHDQVFYIDSPADYLAIKEALMKKTQNPFTNLRLPEPDKEAHTYEEWQRLGEQVAKGETATGRNADGVPTFTADQLVDDEEDYFDEIFLDHLELYE